MDTKKALLTIIIVLAFALIAASLGQLTGYTTKTTTITVSPDSISSKEVADRYITIKVDPGQRIKDKVNIYKGDLRIAENIDLNCGGTCAVRDTGLTKPYWISTNEAEGTYRVEAYDLHGNIVGTGYFEII